MANTLQAGKQEAAKVAFRMEVPARVGPGVSHPVLNFSTAPIFNYYNTMEWKIHCGLAQMKIRIRINHSQRSASIAKGWGDFLNTNALVPGDITTLQPVLTQGSQYLEVVAITKK